MSSLVQTLADPSKRAAIIDDSVKLVDREVASKRGLRAAALKAGYGAVKAIKPGILREAVDKLLPHFAPAVDPFYAEAVAAGGPVRAYFSPRAEPIAEALLAVTDAKVAAADNRVIKRVYRSLRPQAKKHTADAVPGLADLIERHVTP